VQHRPAARDDPPDCRATPTAARSPAPPQRLARTDADTDDEWTHDASPIHAAVCSSASPPDWITRSFGWSFRGMPPYLVRDRRESMRGIQDHACVPSSWDAGSIPRCWPAARSRESPGCSCQSTSSPPRIVRRRLYTDEARALNDRTLDGSATSPRRGTAGAAPSRAWIASQRSLDQGSIPDRGTATLGFNRS
jgi:hypothetical protein